jgi:hypothetical protein
MNRHEQTLKGVTTKDINNRRILFTPLHKKMKTGVIWRPVSPARLTESFFPPCKGPRSGPSSPHCVISAGPAPGPRIHGRYYPWPGPIFCLRKPHGSPPSTDLLFGRCEYYPCFGSANHLWARIYSDLMAYLSKISDFIGFSITCGHQFMWKGGYLTKWGKTEPVQGLIEMKWGGG